MNNTNRNDPVRLLWNSSFPLGMYDIDLNVDSLEPTLLHRNFGEHISDLQYGKLWHEIANYLNSGPPGKTYQFFNKVKPIEEKTTTWRLHCCKLQVHKDSRIATLFVFTYDIEQLDKSKYGLLFFLEGERFFLENYHKVDSLTRREREILALTAKGLSAKLIAAEIFLSQHTVNTHLKNVYEKLSANSRADLMKYAHIFDIR